jgi:putative ABC transport system permease protein
MIKDYFLLAFGNLKHRGLRSLLTILGIFIGIAAVVSLISLGQGLQEAITGQFASLSVDRLLIQNAGTAFGPPGSAAIAKLTDHDVKLIESVKGLDIVVPRILRVAKFEFNSIASFEFVGSIPRDKEGTDFIYNTFQIKAQQGKLLYPEDKGKILLGSDFLDSDRFEKPLRVGSKVKIQGTDFEILGFMAETGSFQFNSAVFMLEDDMEKIFNIKNEYDFIVVQVSDKNNVEPVAQEIERKLRQDRHEKLGEEDFSVQTPAQALGSVNLILNIINLIVGGIAAISLLVGGIGITNTMFTSVLERRKEIGVMKSIGAKNKDVLLVFLIESGLLGLVGGVIGAIIGLSLAFAVAEIANSALGSVILKVQVSYALLFLSIAFSFLIGLFSGVVPALQASKMKPVEALRQ